MGDIHMAVLIGAARIDESNGVVGKVPGDQTSKEVMIHDWYDDDWKYLLRPKYEHVAEASAKIMEQCCENNNIGYSQINRLGLYEAAKKVGFNITLIKTPCDCDCSSLIAVCAIGAGVDVSPELYTGNEVAQFRNSGQYEVITSGVYLRQSYYLKRGDILVTPFSHTAMVLSNGSKVNEQNDNPIAIEPATAMKVDLAGTYKATTDVYIRRGAGTNFKAIGVLKEGNVCRNYGYYTPKGSTNWLYIKRGDTEGYVSSKYLVKV